MIDTVFFLLVYFLIASLTMTHLNARRVSLPISDTALVKPTADVVLTIDKEGGCFLDRSAIDETRIPSALNKRLQTTPKLTVVINCDKNEPVQRFAAIYDLVKQSDASSVMVATTPRSDWVN